jgi:CcmD family protein
MIRIRTLWRILALAALLSTSPTLAAQDSAAASNGLPAGMGVPRTLRSYTHVFVAFSVAWVLLFGYTVSVGRRFKRLEEQVEALSRG